jgi:hypothetical protein
MSQIRHALKSRKVQVALALTLIAIAVVFSFFLPKEEDPDIGLINDSSTPTVSMTNPVGSLTVNHSVHFDNVTLTVTKVLEASAFGDDLKEIGAYTIRVNVQVQPDKSVQSPRGINYASQVYLVLANGQHISTKLVNLSQVVFPNQMQLGYIDFAVNAKVALSSLMLSIGNSGSVAFGG